MGKFKKGLFFGGLLGAGLMWMGTTKKGREMRDSLLDQAADVYEEVKTKVMKSDGWDKMTKQKYVAMVRDVVDTYAVQNGLAKEVKEMVVKVVGSQWKRLQAELKKKK